MIYLLIDLYIVWLIKYLYVFSSLSELYCNKKLCNHVNLLIKLGRGFFLLVFYFNLTVNRCPFIHVLIKSPCMNNTAAIICQQKTDKSIKDTNKKIIYVRGDTISPRHMWHYEFLNYYDFITYSLNMRYHNGIIYMTVA